MAIFKIINEKKPSIEVKAFPCGIDTLCGWIKVLLDTLYHDGNGVIPENGNVIYKINGINQYELFKNNTAAISIAGYENNYSTYIKTDNNGVCTIINCN